MFNVSTTKRCSALNLTTAFITACDTCRPFYDTKVHIVIKLITRNYVTHVTSSDVISGLNKSSLLGECRLHS